MAEWQICKIGDIAKINENSYSAKDHITFANYLDTGNITRNVIDEIQFIDIAEEKLPSRAKRKVKYNSIIYSTVRPNQLHYGIIKEQPENFVVSTGFAVIDVNTELADADYIYYFLTQNTITETLQAIGEQSTSAYPSIKPTDIADIEIILPELTEQKRISNILSTIDGKIKNNTDINNNLYQLIDAYYKKIFNQKDCELTTIGEYATKIYSGGTPSTSNDTYWNGTLGWLSSGETKNRFIINTDKTITEEGVNNSSTKLAHKYDIVMASAGQGHTRGQTSMLFTDTYVNQSIIVIHSEKIYLPFIFWNLASRYEELRAISDSNSIRGSLTTKVILNFPIPKADIDIIKQFSDFAWGSIPKIENNLFENERLIAMRECLLPKLMSGELDVSEINI